MWLCMHCTVGRSTGSKNRVFIHNPQQLKDFHYKFSFMWNIPLSRMLLYAKSKIPILPIPNRSQFDCMCLINFSTAVSISSPKRKTELREQFSHASEGRRALGFCFLYLRGQEQGGSPWTQQTVTTCLAFLGVKSLHSPGDGQRAAPGSCSSCSPHIFFCHTPPIKPTDENRA